MKKTWIALSLLIAFSASSLLPMQAKEAALPKDERYHLVNTSEKGEYELLNTYDSYTEAEKNFQRLSKKYNNLGITYGDSFLQVEQGVVAFPTNSDCSLNTDYILDETNTNGYLNGCYGGDAAFLEYDSYTNQIKFKISGVVAWSDATALTVYPIEKLPNVSSFIVKDGILYHQLKSSATSPSFSSVLPLSKAPSYLKESTTYYSYDTHYFYEAYDQLIKDERLATHQHAINAKKPYYNYYQYLDHRSTTDYTPKQIQSYFKQNLGFQANITNFYDTDNYVHDILTQSLLYGNSEAFFQYQNQFGANALMMLSLSLNESALGKSYIAYNKNNLFGHAAFDSSAEESASRYQSVAASVYSHALHYLSESYLNPEAFQYYGGYFGNKAGGMNVAYASDPYWGEKATSYFMRMDRDMGYQDENNYQLGIAQGQAVKVYASASKKAKLLYTTEEGYDASFILQKKIKNKSGTWYQVQSDIALTKSKESIQDGSYPFATSIGYVKADDIDVITGAEKAATKSYLPITFDAVDGSFYPNTSSITLFVEKGQMPVILDPIKENALFDGWDITLEPATNALTYKATYKHIKNIEVIEKPQTKYNLGDTLNLKHGKIRVTFEDGSNKEVALNNDMVSGFHNDQSGKQRLTITYGGSTTYYDIEMDNQQEERINDVKKQAAHVIKTYMGKVGLNSEALDELIRLRNQLGQFDMQVLPRDQIRVIDRILQENLEPRYSVIIKDDTYDMQVSGLSIALQGESSFLNNIMPKTLRLDVSNDIPKEEKQFVEKVAKANGMNVASYLAIEGTDDFSTLKLQSQLVYSIQKPKKDIDHRIYSVYYISGKDIYQLPTTQSKNRIVFPNDKLGHYAVVWKHADSITHSKDFQEVNTIEQNGKDYIKVYILLPCIIILLTLALLALILYMRKRKIKPFKA